MKHYTDAQQREAHRAWEGIVRVAEGMSDFLRSFRVTRASYTAEWLRNVYGD